MKQVIVRLPGMKAVSRNQTGGHYFKYRAELQKAELWAKTYAKSVEYHFEKQVDVLIEAYYQVGKGFKNAQVADTPNIDDKIFTDILNRFKPRGKNKGKAIERDPWFIQDDKWIYLRYVTKRAYASDHYEVVITITEVEDPPSKSLDLTP